MRNVERAKAGVCVFSLRVPQTYVDVVVFGGGADGAHLGTVGGEGVLGIFCCGGGVEGAAPVSFISVNAYHPC